MPKENIYRDGRPDRAVTVGWFKADTNRFDGWVSVRTNWPEVALGPDEVDRLIAVLQRAKNQMRK